MTHNPGLKRRCLVVGGSGTLGGVVCRALVDAGAEVALTWHSREDRALALQADHPALHIFQLDARDADSITRTVTAAADALGGLDALIHCAAVALAPGVQPPSDTYQLMEDITPDQWDALMQVNLRSVFLASQRALPMLKEAGGGNMVFVGSVDSVKPVPSPVHYAASKAALAGLARSMAKELGPHNIRVNVLAPGILAEGLSSTIPSDLIEQFKKHSALGRQGQLAEVASTIVWLALDNTYVTGQTIAVDGGL